VKLVARTAGETPRMPIGESRRFRSTLQNLPISLLGGYTDKRIVTRGLRVLVVMVLACCALFPAANAQQQPSSESDKLTSLIGQPAPFFLVKTLDGKEVFLSDFKGKTLIVNFWATWCGNCKVEMPWLAELREKYRSRGVEVLGILTDSASAAKVAAITQKYGVKYPILMCNHKTAQAYGGIPDLPESFFIDRQGRIVAEMNGADSAHELEENIRKSLEHSER
jgi:cytochrome c biogenesis protein CcmG/thiol:disulfide interchange protein DsbE